VRRLYASHKGDALLPPPVTEVLQFYNAGITTTDPIRDDVGEKCSDFFLLGIEGKRI